MEIQKGSSYKAYIRLNSTSGYLSPVTGVASPSIAISLNGSSAYLSSGLTWSEVDRDFMPGLYSVQVTSAQTSAAGPLCIGVTKTGCVPEVVVYDVVDYAEAQVTSGVSELGSEISTYAGSVQANTLGNSLKLMRKLLTNKTSGSASTLTVFDDNNVNVLGVFHWNAQTSTRDKMT